MIDFEAKLDELKTIYSYALTVAPIWRAPSFVMEWLTPSCFIGASALDIEASLFDLEPSCPQDATEAQIKRFHAQTHAYSATLNAVEATKSYNNLRTAVQRQDKPRRINRLEKGISANVYYASCNARSAVNLLMNSLLLEARERQEAAEAVKRRTRMIARKRMAATREAADQ